MIQENLLIVADSVRDANMLYAVGFFASDPFIYLNLKNRGYVIVGDLELDQARHQARHCRVISLRHYQQTLQRKNGKDPSVAEVIHFFLRQRQLETIQVPENFPLGLAMKLRELDITVHVKEGPCFPQRALKTADEIKKISAALMMVEVGLAEAVQVLKAAKISRNGRLQYHDVPLTVEKLRSVINVALLQAGGTVHRTIVASGRQGCDPHEVGHGVLRAHQPIILDITSRSQKTGYFGDITRTVVKGQASEAVRQLYHTVVRGQAVAMAQISHNVPGVDVHRVVQEFFMHQNYRTTRNNGHPQGFIHSIGHGIGLELHETPRMDDGSNDILQAGHVVTVEPGLYYPRLGGVRLEDVVLVTRKEPVNLTKFEKTLEV